MQTQTRKTLPPPIPVRALTPDEFSQYERVLEANRKINAARKAIKDFDERRDRQRIRLMNVLHQSQREFDDATQAVRS